MAKSKRKYVDKPHKKTNSSNGVNTHQSKKIKRQKKRQFKQIKMESAVKGSSTSNYEKTEGMKKRQPDISQQGSLRERMMNKLQGARFRFLNEKIYTTDGTEASKLFKNDPHAFEAYHEGFKKQVSHWKINPVDTIINNLKKKSSSLVIADFGCGDALIANSLPNVVHSFDLVALNSLVTSCDMAHTPLEDSAIDVAVFCLSLMGTNLTEYLKEANRVLKLEGILKIAEVESRFEDVNKFVSKMKKLGFKCVSKNLSNSHFYFLDFKKEIDIKHKSELPKINLKPCIYKKR